MRKLALLLALLPGLAFGQYYGPIYNPANVNITGGSVFATTTNAPPITVSGAQLGSFNSAGSLTFVDPARSAGNKIAYVDWGATNLVFGFAADDGSNGTNALTITGGNAQGISGITSNSGTGVWTHTGAFSASGGLRAKEGANAKQGIATLAAGTVTVPNTSITANSRVFLTSQSNGVIGALRCSAKVAGTSFTITSSIASEIGTVAYEIFEPGS